MDNRLKELYKRREVLLNGGSLVEKSDVVEVPLESTTPNLDLLEFRSIVEESKGAYVETLSKVSEIVDSNKIKSLKVNRDVMGLIDTIEIVYD